MRYFSKENITPKMMADKPFLISGILLSLSYRILSTKTLIPSKFRLLSGKSYCAKHILYSFKCPTFIYKNNQFLVSFVSLSFFSQSLFLSPLSLSLSPSLLPPSFSLSFLSSLNLTHFNLFQSLSSLSFLVKILTNLTIAPP